jgi:hypothetical protein
MEVTEADSGIVAQSSKSAVIGFLAKIINCLSRCRFNEKRNSFNNALISLHTRVNTSRWTVLSVCPQEEEQSKNQYAIILYIYLGVLFC